MARPTSFTQEDVDRVIRQLLAAGQWPTRNAVRDVLGGGSPPVLNAAIQSWFTRFGPSLDTAAGSTLPVDFDQYLAALAAAHHTADQQFQAVLQGRLAELRALKADVHAGQQRLAVGKELLEEQKASLHEAVVGMSRQALDAQAAEATARAEAYGAKVERDAAVEELQRLHVTVQTLSTERDGQADALRAERELSTSMKLKIEAAENILRSRHALEEDVIARLEAMIERVVFQLIDRLETRE